MAIPGRDSGTTGPIPRSGGRQQRTGAVNADPVEREQVLVAVTEQSPLNSWSIPAVGGIENQPNEERSAGDFESDHAPRLPGDRSERPPLQYQRAARCASRTMNIPDMATLPSRDTGGVSHPAHRGANNVDTRMGGVAALAPGAGVPPSSQLVRPPIHLDALILYSVAITGGEPLEVRVTRRDY